MKAGILSNSLRKRLRRLFVSKARPVDTIESKPQGINRTVFEDAVVNYFEPINPHKVHTTQQCINKFGRKYPVQFKQMTLATQNTFKS